MEMEYLRPEKTESKPVTGDRITAFTAVRQDYGLEIKVAGCVSLRPAQNAAKNVIGIVDLDDQMVPVLDARKQRDNNISDLSCIVLFENIVGQTTIVTGRLYESACQVFDLIVECMDQPETHDNLYSQTEHPLISETAE